MFVVSSPAYVTMWFDNHTVAVGYGGGKRFGMKNELIVFNASEICNASQKTRGKKDLQELAAVETGRKQVVDLENDIPWCASNVIGGIFCISHIDSFSVFTTDEEGKISRRGKFTLPQTDDVNPDKKPIRLLVHKKVLLAAVGLDSGELLLVRVSIKNEVNFREVARVKAKSRISDIDTLSSPKTARILVASKTHGVAVLALEADRLVQVGEYPCGTVNNVVVRFAAFTSVGALVVTYKKGSRDTTLTMINTKMKKLFSRPLQGELVTSMAPGKDKYAEFVFGTAKGTVLNVAARRHAFAITFNIQRVHSEPITSAAVAHRGNPVVCSTDIAQRVILTDVRLVEASKRNRATMVLFFLFLVGFLVVYNIVLSFPAINQFFESMTDGGQDL